MFELCSIGLLCIGILCIGLLCILYTVKGKTATKALFFYLKCGVL